MATTPVYLTDDDGNIIVGADDQAIIVGYVTTSLLVGQNGDDLTSELPGGGTTFRDVVTNASPEEKLEVRKGLRLAKSIRGRLNRFEIGEGPSDFYVKYNHSIFGGRFQSAYTALGAIAGTYLRRGGIAFTKELVDAALVSGPFARFNNFQSSPVLPGDVTFDVTAGGGTVSAINWNISNGVDAPLTPTGESVTVNLSEATWTVSATATIDGEEVSIDAQTLEVSSLALTGAMTVSSSPAVGQPVDIAFPVNSNSLLGDIDWSFNVELAAGQRVDLTPDVDYVVNSENTNTINVTFLTAGVIETTAVIQDANGDVATTQANIDVTDLDTPNTVTDHSILSQATADALVQGDAHLIMLGDSIGSHVHEDRWRRGMVDSFRPARWVGIQPAIEDANDTAHDGSRWSTSFFTQNLGNTLSSANVRRDGTALNNNSAVMDSRLAELRTCEADFTQLTSTSASSSFALTQSARTGDSNFLRGRLQSDTDQFYRDQSQSTRVLLYNLDGTPTIRAGADDSAAETVVTLSPDSYSLVTVDRSVSPLQQDTDYKIFDASFDSGINGNAFGLMDNFWYSPAQSGLSLSYLGNGGYNTSNHTNSAARVAANAGRKDMYYNDEAIDAHLEMVAFKSGSTLRDNIVIMIEIQNVSQNGEGHDGQMRTDLLNIITRWQDAADRVNAGIKSRITFVVVAMPELANNGANQHDAVAEMMPDIATLGGYSKVEFIDLHNAIKSFAGGIYANPNDYTEVGTGTGTATDPQFLWYAGGDAVHPTLVGSQKQMEIMWSVITDAASDPTGFSFTINAPASGTTGDTYNYTLSGSLPADRLVTWSVDGSIVAYGDSYTLPSVAGTYVVSAQVDGVDGSVATATASSVTITTPNSAPTFTTQPRLQAGQTPVEGGLVVIEVEALDTDGNDLTYTTSDGQVLGPFASGAQVTFNVTAGTAGTPQTVSVSVSDGIVSVDSDDLVFTPASPNTAPSIGTFSAGAGPFTEGDTVNLAAASIVDAESDTLTYTITLAIDGVTQPGTIASGTVPGSGVVVASDVVDTAGSYVYTMTVTDTSGASAAATSSITVDAAPAETLVGQMTATTIGSNNMNNNSLWTIDAGMEAWYDSFHSGSRNINTFMGVNNGFTRLFLNAGSTPNPTTAELDTLAASLSSGGTHQLRVVMGSVTYVWTGTWNDVNATVNPRIDYSSSDEVLKDGVATTAAQFKNDLAASSGESIAVQIWEL